jgi:hypothetical protein
VGELDVAGEEAPGPGDEAMKGVGPAGAAPAGKAPAAGAPGAPGNGKGGFYVDSQGAVNHRTF